MAGSGHHIVVDIEGSFSRGSLDKMAGLSRCFEVGSGGVCTMRWVIVGSGETMSGQLVIGVSREVVDELVRKVDVTGSW